MRAGTDGQAKGYLRFNLVNLHKNGHFHTISKITWVLIGAVEESLQEKGKIRGKALSRENAYRVHERLKLGINYEQRLVRMEKAGNIQ